MACRLNFRGPSITVASKGMGHLSLMILLLRYLNRLTKRSKYFGGCNILLDSMCFLISEKAFCNNPIRVPNVHCMA